jgi:hypothetical protein
MAVLVELLGPLTATVTAYGLYRLIKLYYEEFSSPLRDLPGPKSSSLIYGNIKEIWEAVRHRVSMTVFLDLTLPFEYKENSVLHEKWVAEYGTTIQYKGLFGVSGLHHS